MSRRGDRGGEERKKKQVAGEQMGGLKRNGSSCLPSVLAYIYMLLRQRAPLRGVISCLHVSWRCCLAT